MEWEDGLKPLARKVLYTCSYIPEEIIVAAGMSPERFFGDPQGSAPETPLHPRTCGYAKSLLAGALVHPPPGTAGIVVANSCDAMRRLYDLWQAYVGQPAALFLEVPKKQDADSITFFAAELRRLAVRLEKDLGGEPVTRASLQEAVACSNRARRLVREVLDLQRDPGSDVGAAEVFELCLLGVTAGPSELCRKAAALLPTLRSRARRAARPRLLLTGGILHQANLLRFIEELGAHVVVVDTCQGLRHYAGLVDESQQDLMLALARRYLLKPACARMEGLEAWLRHLEELARSCGVDGVVCTTVKFCDPFAYNVPLLTERFSLIRIPFLFIENDYRWADEGQIRTSVEAFLETID